MKANYTYNRFLKLIIVITLIIITSNIFAQKHQVNPYDLKAAYVVKICKFTNWVNESDRKNQTFKIYTIGNSSDKKGLQIRTDIFINGRSIEVIHIESIDLIKDYSDVDAIYIYEVTNEELIEILKAVEQKNIITFSENEGFGGLGVIINFFIINNKINFEINRNAELKSKITLRSDLYRVKGVKIIE